MQLPTWTALLHIVLKDVTLRRTSPWKTGGLGSACFSVCPRAHPIPSLGFRFLIYDMKVQSRDTIIFNAESLVLAVAFDLLAS